MKSEGATRRVGEFAINRSKDYFKVGDPVVFFVRKGLPSQRNTICAGRISVIEKSGMMSIGDTIRSVLAGDTPFRAHYQSCQVIDRAFWDHLLSIIDVQGFEVACQRLSSWLELSCEDSDESKCHREELLHIFRRSVQGKMPEILPARKLLMLKTVLGLSQVLLPEDPAVLYVITNEDGRGTLVEASYLGVDEKNDFSALRVVDNHSDLQYRELHAIEQNSPGIIPRWIYEYWREHAKEGIVDQYLSEMKEFMMMGHRINCEVFRNVILQSFKENKITSMDCGQYFDWAHR